MQYAIARDTNGNRTLRITPPQGRGFSIQTNRTEEFLDAYITAALWSSTYEDDDQEDIPMDDGEHELAPETRLKMQADCEAFIARCNVIGLDPFPEYPSRNEYSDAELSGHDFWLTRNGHGCGYWDRDLDTGDALTATAESFGRRDLYVGDDGLIYQS